MLPEGVKGNSKEPRCGCLTIRSSRAQAFGQRINYLEPKDYRSPVIGLTRGPKTRDA